MNDESYINNVTLQYLLNPMLQSKLNLHMKNPDNNLNKDILFYRRRICDLTKQMCKGEFINPSFKTNFLNYVSFIIYFLKQQDEKDFLQKEYDNLDIKVVKNEDQDPNNEELNSQIPILPDSMEITDVSNNLGNDLLINKIAGDFTLNKYVKKNKTKEIDKVFPQERCANLKDPILKRKGLKKKNI